MRLLLVAVLLLEGCFQPVDPDGRIVSSCKGSCPYGQCDEHCAAGADASCVTPEDCLTAYSCAKSGATSCASYKADFQAAGCAQSTGSYCVTTLAAYGVRQTFAVVCSDAGQRSTQCPGFDPCEDAGTYPPECRTACGPKYCVR